ncbi:MAG: hypothetical protein ACFFCM_02540 [Promethearchaeota archaeon]
MMYDLIRILGIIFLGFIRVNMDIFFGSTRINIDMIGFNLKIFLFFFGTSIFIQIIQIYSKQSGHLTKKDGLINTIYFILIPLISILNAYTFIKTNINEYGFYFCQIHPLVFLLILVIFSPLVPYAIFKVKEFEGEIKNKKTIKQSNLCISLLILIEIINIMGIISYLIFNNSIYILITNLLLLLGSALAFIFILFLKYPYFLTAISTYFSIKSIYIIGSKGIIIYEFDFQKETTKDILSTTEILLGGFLYIIDSGLVTLFDIKGDIKSITIGNMNLLFTHGKFVFGLILSTEQTSLLLRKLRKFIEKFENTYKNELEDWSGDLTVYNSELIKNWIDEFFR